jgi:hypothetical protein
MQSTGRLALILMLVGGVAAFAALFGPARPWGGLDFGAIGASVFTLTIIAAVWLFAVHGERVFPEHTSIAERRGWVGLVFLAFILLAFAREMYVLSGSAVIPERIDDLFARRFLERYVLLAIAWGVISHLIGRGDGGVEEDERDLRVRHRADRAGDWALSLIVIMGIIVLALVPRELLTWWLAPIVLANVLLGLLIAKSLVEHVVLTLSYRSFNGSVAGRA